MGSFIKGEVVVFPFPFSDLSDKKRRPALVLADLQGADIILCMITTSRYTDRDSISLDDNDFSRGKLSQPSMIRANRVFTGDSNDVYYSVGHLKPSKTKEVIDKLIEILSR
jgi:mRNA interferase MazF